MTNRTWIETTGRLPRRMRCWLEPYYTIHLDTVPIRVAQLRAYGREQFAYSDGRCVYVDADQWPKLDTARLFQTLAHEYTHVEQYRTQGWLRWLLEGASTVGRSLIRGKVYDHTVSRYEREATARSRQVMDGNAEAREQWAGLLDDKFSE